MSRDEFYFHRRVRFTALAQTKKALLVEIHEVHSRTFHLLKMKYGNILSPMQIWLPKTWFKRGMYNDIWIWEKGLMMNLHKLIEKREGMVEDAMKEKSYAGILH